MLRRFSLFLYGQLTAKDGFSLDSLLIGIIEVTVEDHGTVFVDRDKTGIAASTVPLMPGWSLDRLICKMAAILRFDKSEFLPFVTVLCECHVHTGTRIAKHSYTAGESYKPWKDTGFGEGLGL